jgi:DNA-binding NarL/FixJ family response regulator
VATLPNSASQADTRRRPRRLTSLFSRVLITNTVLLALAPLAAGFLRASGKGHFDGRFALVAGLPLLVLWVMNFYFLRGAFTPLRTLSEFADRVELLRPGRRLELESRTAEIVVLTDAMNRMLARLEQEQRSSTRRAVAAQAGASGYVLKSAADRDLVEACRAAMRGEPFLYPGAITALIRDFLDRDRNGDSRDDPLTPREQEILKLIAESYGNQQIADALVISVKTVERHRANILEKLGMHDRVQLTRYAIRRGLIDP